MGIRNTHEGKAMRLPGFILSKPSRKEKVIGFADYWINFPAVCELYRKIYSRQITKKTSLGLSWAQIETINMCNLRCKMCSLPEMTRKKTIMDMDLFKKIIDDAAESGIKKIWLNLFGEPLLDPLIFSRIKYAKSKSLYAGFNSNGTLLSADKAERLLETGLDEVIFSIDGALKETYERIRVGASFNEVKANIINTIEMRNKAGYQNPAIKVHFVIQKDNFNEIAEFNSFWTGIADSISTEMAFPISEKVKDLSLLKRTKQRYTYPCPNIFSHLTVLSDGMVPLCCVDFNGQIIIGDLNVQTITEVWNSGTFKNLRELHLAGKGAQIKLCRETNCSFLRKSNWAWWFE